MAVGQSLENLLAKLTCQPTRSVKKPALQIREHGSVLFDSQGVFPRAHVPLETGIIFCLRDSATVPIQPVSRIDLDLLRVRFLTNSITVEKGSV